MQQELIIYTDGACKGNPGVGGWGAVLIYGNTTKEIFGYCGHTTNNQMELVAVIEALKILKRSCNITIYTDSKYVQQGITEWINGWIKRNWKGVKNIELWQELHLQAQKHQISWQWVRGHNGNTLNERADELANLAILNHE